VDDIQQDHSKPAAGKPRPSWKRASQDQKENFKEVLEENLSHLTIPSSVLLCRDLHCTNTNHKQELDIFTLNLLESVQEVAENCLPVPGSGENSNRNQMKNCPGWKEAVKPYRDDAYFWHQTWKSWGRPINNDLHKMMKKTRNKYHKKYKSTKSAKRQRRRSRKANFLKHVSVVMEICSRNLNH
jgi:hypothetical protein